MTTGLLTRDQFREGVFARDKNLCVICGGPGQDAHHILERRLFSDGGYYLDNGATLCGSHHLSAESTEISVEEIRFRTGITNFVIPGHLYRDQDYDKWGNPILPGGQRLRGELFYDESVQKVLRPVLHLYTNRVKYPRTSHLPWSPGFTDDDRFLDAETLKLWADCEVVVTEKMDGENTTMYFDGIHARSLTYESRYDRDRIKAFHAYNKHHIPADWRICGENLTAVHTIKYEKLPHFFLVFGIWCRDVCLNWDDTAMYAAVMGLHMVPVLYRGPFRNFAHVNLHLDPDNQEGYVIRPVEPFRMRDFPIMVGKYVRAGHVADSHVHWTRRKIEWNSWIE